MRTSRYNIYSYIHKALRSAMADTLVGLGRADYCDDEGVSTVLDQAGELLDLCQSHLKHENDYIHSAMLARRPDLDPDTVRDHEHHELSITRLRADMRRLSLTPAGERQQPMNALYRQFALFVAENYQHMEVEESDNNQVLWDCYEDAELIAIEQAIVSSLPQAERARVAALMLPVVNVTERLELVEAMREGMPAAAFEDLLDMLRQKLDAAEWRKLLDGLGIETPVRVAA